MASSSSNTHSDFLLAPSPERIPFIVWYIWSPLWTIDSGPQTKKGSNFCVGLGQSTFCNGSQIQITRPHTSLGDLVCHIVDLFLEDTLMAWVLGYTSWAAWRPHTVCGSVPLPLARKWLCHLSRWGNKWGLTCQDNFASVSETWPAHCTAQRACHHIQKTPNCLWWRQCIVLMPPPFSFAKTLIWGLGMKNVQHLPDSPMPPEFSAGCRSPFCMHIQMAEVNTELKASVLLPNQYYGIAPSALTRLDGTWF